MKSMFFRSLALMSIIALTLSGCIKNDFDEPPVRTIPVGNLKTIADIRNLYQGQPVKITEDWSLYAVVTMDERSGNIYRSIYIQDKTGAVNLHLNSSGGLYQGDSIRLYLKGTVISEYSGMLQIDSVDVDEHVVKQATLTDVVPQTVTIQDLNTGFYQARLVRLDSVQFKTSELGNTFADPITLYSMNRMLEDCEKNEIIVRTSGYANFAGELLPEGRGSMVAIVSEYNGDLQLYVRSYAEINMNGPRCGGGVGPQDLMPIKNVRDLFTGTATTVPANKKIRGIIISDRANSNLTSRNAFILDENGDGIALRFDETHNFSLNQEVEINVSNMELSEFRGLLQLNNVPVDNVAILGTAPAPVPLNVHIEDLNDDFEAYEAKLVRLSNVTISKTGGFTDYKYTCILNDGTGTINMFTTDYASFASTNFPTYPVHITCIVSQYDDPQVLIRNLTDVVQAK